jgi:hypothetical protein
MNFTGININNSYIIREKIHEDPVCTNWLSHSIFSTKRFIIKFIMKNKFKNQKNLLNFKREFLNSKKITNECVINFLEIDEYRHYIFISVEVPDGESLAEFTKRERKPDKNILKNLFIDIAIAYDSLNKSGYPARDITIKDLWVVDSIKTSPKVKVLNFQTGLIRKFLDFTEDAFSNNKAAFLSANPGALTELGILFYQVLSHDYRLERINAFVEKHKPGAQQKSASGIPKITLKLLSGKYSDIGKVKNDLDRLYRKPDKMYSKKESNGTKSDQNKFKDVFEERRHYFDTLERERQKRIESSVIERPFDIEKEDAILKEYNTRLFAERRFYFENNEKERWSYLNFSTDISRKHIDELIDQSRRYYEDRMNQNIEGEITMEDKETRISGFIKKISEQIKKYLKALKKENAKYMSIIRKSLKNKDADKDRYLEDKKTEALKQMKKLAVTSKQYFNNITNEMKNDLNSENIDDPEVKKDLEQINRIISRTDSLYKKIMPDKNKNKTDDKKDKNVQTEIRIKTVGKQKSVKGNDIINTDSTTKKSVDIQTNNDPVNSSKSTGTNKQENNIPEKHEDMRIESDDKRIDEKSGTGKNNINVGISKKNSDGFLNKAGDDRSGAIETVQERMKDDGEDEKEPSQSYTVGSAGKTPKKRMTLLRLMKYYLLLIRGHVKTKLRFGK